MIGYVIAGLAVVLLVAVLGVYNKFINLKNGIDNNFSQIKVAMKKRTDMIGQLVDTASSYLKFEKTTLEGVTKMRNISLDTPEGLKEADALSRSVFGKILAVSERYPKLKGIEAIKPLQENVKELEEEIGRLRYLYNDEVQTFNTMSERVPTNVVAGAFGFRKKEYLQFEEGIEKRPDTKVF
jgi:LemA protein